MNKFERAVAHTALGLACVAGVSFAFRALPSAQAATAPSADHTVAIVDVLQVAEKLFLSPKYLPAREAMLKEKQGQVETLQKELQDLVTKIQSAGQNSPEAEPLRQQYQAQAPSFNKLREDANSELNTLSTQQ